MVLFSDPSAAALCDVNLVGTVVVCLLKGALAGLCAGLLYKAFEKKSTVLGTALAAVAAPVINTGVFLLGCRVFFMDTLREWAFSNGSENVVAYIFLVLVGFNFLFELAVNVLLCPAIVRVIRAISTIIQGKKA